MEMQVLLTIQFLLGLTVFILDTKRINELKHKLKYSKMYIKQVTESSTEFRIDRECIENFEQDATKVIQNILKSRYFNKNIDRDELDKIYNDRRLFLSDVIYEEMILHIDDYTYDQFQKLAKTKTVKGTMISKMEPLLLTVLEELYKKEEKVSILERLNKSLQAKQVQFNEMVSKMKEQIKRLEAEKESLRLSAINSQGNSYESIMKTITHIYKHHVNEYFRLKVRTSTPSNFSTGHYKYNFPNSNEEKEELILNLIKEVMSSLSEDFKRRIEIFFSISYFETMIGQRIRDEYRHQYRKAQKDLHELNRNSMRIEKEKDDFALEAKHKSLIKEYKPANQLLSLFGIKPVLPEDPKKVDEFNKKADMNEIPELKTLRAKYLLNKSKIRPLQDIVTPRNFADFIKIDDLKPVENEDGILIAEVGTDEENALLAVLANALRWDVVPVTKHRIEECKLAIVEACLEQGLNPIKEKMFGDYINPPRVSDSRGIPLLNPRFYDPGVYENDYKDLIEAVHSEGLQSILEIH